MKQRLRNTLAILSDASLLIMDEPTSHLDLEGVEWYQQLLLSHASGRLILIGSNMERDYHGRTQAADVGVQAGGQARNCASVFLMISMHSSICSSVMTRRRAKRILSP